MASHRISNDCTLSVHTFGPMDGSLENRPDRDNCPCVLACELHEHSSFKRYQGVWKYPDGKGRFQDCVHHLDRQATVGFGRASPAAE
jgi:hypothetical protein